MKRNLLALGILVAGLTASAQTPRLSLFEEFTGETCPPCASTNPGLNTKLLSATNATKIVAIKWQVPIPSAPSKSWSLYQTDKAEIDWRYKSTANGGYGYVPAVTYAPFGKIDGQSLAVYGSTGSSVDHPVNVSNAMIATAQSYTSAFSITMTRAWDQTCSAVNLTINIQATAPFTAVGNLVFRTVLVERLIQFSVQPGTNGEKDFNDAARKSYPSLQTGVPMASSWTVGQTQTFTLNCVLPNYIVKKEEIAFVGFIQDDGDQKVAQACRADKVPLPQDALSTLGAKVNVTCGNTISPMATIKNSGAVAITNLTITPYVDGVAGANVSWTGNLAAGATTNIPLNTLTTGTTAGTHTFSYTAQMAASPYNLTNVSNSVNYLVVSNYQGTPVTEGFPATAFPPTKWTNVNPDNGSNWTRVSNAGGYNVAPLHSIKYDFYNNTVIGDQDELYLPPVDLSGGSDPVMTFDIAYQQRTATSNDQLQVYVSDNCGANWQKVYDQSGSGLATTAPNTAAYTPDNTDVSQWRTESVTMTGYNKPNVLVKFVTTSDNGNNLYLDNVNLSQLSPVGLSKNSNTALSFNVSPNPTNGITMININAAKASNAKVMVMNAIGQVVYEKNTDINVGSNNIQMDVRGFASGVYYISVESNTGNMVKKLVVNN